MKGRYSDKIQIDTTHFVATSPAAINNPHGGPGVEYQKALQLSIVSSPLSRRFGGKGGKANPLWI